MQTSHEVIAEVVERATGSALVTKTRVTAGFSNEVYDAETVDGQRVIVRIHHPFVSDAPYFLEERWALERCTDARVAAPRLLLLTQASDPANGRRLSLMVEARLDGESLAELLAEGAMRREAAQPVLAEVGSALARLHSIRTTGFGRIGPTGVGSEIEYQLLPYSLSHLRQRARDAGLGTGEIALVAETYDAVERHQALWVELIAEGPVPRLLHGDLGPQHIIVAGGHLRGLIDFELPESGDPAEEVAGWDRAYGEELLIAWLLEGYRAEAPADATFDLRVALHRARISFAQLGRPNPPPGLTELVRQKLPLDVGLLRRLGQLSAS